MRWVWRGITGATLVLGWLFILWQNKFHLDPPVVIVMLGYLAVVMTVTNLWRVGAAAVAPARSDDSWARPLGAYWELEKEKKTLLKQIKEAEFDQAMRKLSKADAEQLILMYRARAIEVIKELDRLEAGHAETPRQAIERELAARVLVETEKKKGDKRAKKKVAAAPAVAAAASDEPAKPVDDVVAAADDDDDKPVAAEDAS